MIKIDKNLADIPSHLQGEKVKAAFEANCTSHMYDCDDLYRHAKIKAKLDILYHKKCAFCEKKLLDTVRHIEHFRPKKHNSRIQKCDASFGYYWLAFSWDNLILACGECNSFKGCCFNILGTRALYNNQELKDLHTLCTHYDQIEIPMLVNPEREDPKGRFYFDENASIQAVEGDFRMAYTIETCHLNRDELRELRFEILNDELTNRLQRRFYRLNESKNIQTLVDVIEDFASKNVLTSAFSAWRNYILENFETFVTTGNQQYNKIMKVAFLRWKSQSSPN